MHGDDRPGAVRDFFPDPRGIQVQGRGVDIRENDSRAADAGAGCRADEGERRRDDLVARPHAQRHHAQVEGGAAGVHRHCFCRIFVTGQCILKVGFLRQGKEVSPRLRHVLVLLHVLVFLLVGLLLLTLVTSHLLHVLADHIAQSLPACPDLGYGGFDAQVQGLF